MSGFLISVLPCADAVAVVLIHQVVHQVFAGLHAALLCSVVVLLLLPSSCSLFTAGTLAADY